MDLLKVAQERLTKLMESLQGVDLFAKKLEMDDEGFTPVGLDGPAAAEEKDEKKDDVDSGPEEEEVPTRGYLKRQANLIVDAKSRSKRGNRRR